MLVQVLTGPNQAAIDRVTRCAADLMEAPEWATRDTIQEAATQGMLYGSAEQIVDWIGPLADLGLQEVVFQHYDFDSDEVPEYIASEIASQLSQL